MAKSAKKKRVLWTEAAETDLVALWQKTPQLRCARKNSHVYEEMASGMSSVGHNYTAAEIKIKIHNFTNRLRQEKQKVDASGGSPSAWKHFDAVREAVGSYKSIRSNDLVEDSNIVDISSIDQIYVKSEIELDSPLPSPGAFPSSSASSSDISNRPSSNDSGQNKKKTAVLVMEDMREDFLKATQAMKETDEKRLKILEKYAKDVSEMKDAFIDFLRRQN